MGGFSCSLWFEFCCLFLLWFFVEFKIVIWFGCFVFPWCVCLLICVVLYRCFLVCFIFILVTLFWARPVGRARIRWFLLVFCVWYFRVFLFWCFWVVLKGSVLVLEFMCLFAWFIRLVYVVLGVFVCFVLCFLYVSGCLYVFLIFRGCFLFMFISFLRGFMGLGSCLFAFGILCVLFVFYLCGVIRKCFPFVMFYAFVCLCLYGGFWIFVVLMLGAMCFYFCVVCVRTLGGATFLFGIFVCIGFVFCMSFLCCAFVFTKDACI